MGEPKYITFYIDGSFDKMEAVKDLTLQPQYNIKEYLISHETSNSKGEDKPHFHFLIHAEEKSFNSLYKRLKLLLGAIKPSGQGGYRPYGRLKVPIRNLETLKAYICKDGNVISSMSKETLDDLYKKSYKKNNIEQVWNEFMEHAQSNGSIPAYYYQPNHKEYIDHIRRAILQFLISKEDKISRPKIESYLTKFIRTSSLDPAIKKTILYNHFYT